MQIINLGSDGRDKKRREELLSRSHHVGIVLASVGGVFSFISFSFMLHFFQSHKFDASTKCEGTLS